MIRIESIENEHGLFCESCGDCPDRMYSFYFGGVFHGTYVYLCERCYEELMEKKRVRFRKEYYERKRDLSED